VTAREFSAAIGRHLGRASWLHWPGPVARLVLGEMAALVLSSYNARPARALSLGFQFRFSEIDSALSSIYGTTEEADVRNMKQNKRA
jgi:NAD dependent epimerase/dehydratase family enzyme